MTFRWIHLCIAVLVLAASAVADEPAGRPAANDPLPKTPGHHWLRTRMQMAGRATTLEYIIYLPEGYDKSTRPYPLMLFLHGNGDQGTNLGNAFKWGPGCELERPGNDRFRQSFPLIMLYPQCPPRGQRWDQPAMIAAVHQLLDKTIAGLRVDRTRVYLTGLSMGGTGSWHVALGGPDKFAGIGEFAGVAVRPEEAGSKFKYLAVWGITGDDDIGPTLGNQEMAQAIANAGGTMKITAVPNAGHCVQEPFYASPQWYEWLLARHRLNPAERKAFDAAPAAKPSPIPNAPGHYDLDYQTMVSGRTVQVSYQLTLPKEYKPAGQKWPMVVFMHDQNVFGTEVGGRYVHGVELAMATSKDSAIASLPAVVLSPRCQATSTWEDQTMRQGVHQLVIDLTRQLSIDEHRVAITGEGAGANAAMAMARDFAPTWCAAIPVFTSADATISSDACTLPVAVAGNRQAATRARESLAAQPLFEGYADVRLYQWLLKQAIK